MCTCNGKDRIPVCRDKRCQGAPCKLIYVHTARAYICLQGGVAKVPGLFSYPFVLFPLENICFFFPLESLMFGPVCGMEVSREDGDDLAFCMPMASQCHASQPSPRRLGSCLLSWLSTRRQSHAARSKVIFMVMRS